MHFFCTKLQLHAHRLRVSVQSTLVQTVETHMPQREMFKMVLNWPIVVLFSRIRWRKYNPFSSLHSTKTCVYVAKSVCLCLFF